MRFFSYFTTHFKKSLSSIIIFCHQILFEFIKFDTFIDGGVKKLIFTPPFYGDRKNASEQTNGTTNPFTKGFVGYPKAYDGTSRGDVCS